MKIIYIIHGTYNSAGMERVLILKANHLADKEGYDVCIITTDQRSRPSYYPISPKIRQYDLGINFDEYYNYPILKRVLTFWVKYNACCNRLKKKLITEKADIVVSLMSRVLSFLAQINDGSIKVFEYHFARNVRNQFLVEISASYIQRWAYNYRTRKELMNIKKMDKFVVLTHQDATLWGNLPNLEIIPNPITFYPNSRALLERPQVISIGRIEYQKGYDQLVSIWSIVNKKFPEWKMKVIGNGKGLSALHSQIKEAGLEEIITVNDPTSLVEENLLESSIYLLTSRYEGFPMILGEAMICGLPVIAFKCLCGPEDVIHDGEDGYLIEEGDIVAMADKICLLISDVNKRKLMGKNAYRNIKRFSQEIIMKQWVDLFNRIRH